MKCQDNISKLGDHYYHFYCMFLEEKISYDMLAEDSFNLGQIGSRI